MGSHLPIIFLKMCVVKSITVFSLKRFVFPKYSEKLRRTAKATVTPQLATKHSITYTLLEVQF